MRCRDGFHSGFLHDSSEVTTDEMSDLVNAATGRKKNDQGREVFKHLQTFTKKKKHDSEMTKIYIYIYQEVVVSFFPFLPKLRGFWCCWCLSKYDSDLKFMYSKNTSRYNNHLIDSSTGTIFVNDAKTQKTEMFLSYRGDVWSGMVARFLVSSANCSSCSCLQISGT